MPGRRNALYLLAILSLLIGLLTGRADLFNIAYLIAAVMFLSLVWIWVTLRGIVLRRTTRTRRSQVGRVFHESFGVRKTGILPKLWLEIRDHSTLPGHQASHVVPTLVGKSEYTWDVETVCAARGEFQLGPMTVLSGDPFGLFHSPRRLGATDSLIVYPMTVELDRVQLPIGFPVRRRCPAPADPSDHHQCQQHPRLRFRRQHESHPLALHRAHGQYYGQGIRAGSAGGYLALQ